ncbi:unnamed protein product [Rhizopus stolonifer]
MKRKLSAVEPIDRNLKSKRPNHVMKYGSYEIGLTEGAKADDKSSNKFLEDAMMKVPKILKDMMFRLIEVVPHKKKRTKDSWAGLNITMKSMDISVGHIFRVLSTKSYDYPIVYSLFMILEETVDDINSPASRQMISFNTTTEKVDLPTFY